MPSAVEPVAAQGLSDSGMFQVVVYSSMMAHNITACLDAVLARPQRNMVHRVLDRCEACFREREGGERIVEFDFL